MGGRGDNGGQKFTVGKSANQDNGRKVLWKL